MRIEDAPVLAIGLGAAFAIFHIELHRIIEREAFHIGFSQRLQIALLSRFVWIDPISHVNDVLGSLTAGLRRRHICRAGNAHHHRLSGDVVLDVVRLRVEMAENKEAVLLLVIVDRWVASAVAGGPAPSHP